MNVGINPTYAAAHCCFCTPGCRHSGPERFYCPAHVGHAAPSWLPSWWYPYAPSTTTTTVATWNVTRYVGRHRKGDPEQGA